MSKRPTAGRPEVTSPAEIEQAAFRLFAGRGFDETTLDAIAAEVGVGRRTLFRYYRSKNDIPWGQFDRTLDAFRESLAGMPDDLPLHEAVGRAVLQFNAFPADVSPSHADRMRLIMQTPTLRAHSVLRYTEWRQCIALYAATRLGLAAGDLVPQLVGQVSLALTLTAYEQWLRDPTVDVTELLEDSMAALRDYFAEEGRESTG
ncbi:MAG: mycofactocin system transcriptional regulator [Actinomycetota bacterium]|nr:mycofactocin system transcriptional regulator [Actinomycetota bacterium]